MSAPAILDYNTVARLRQVGHEPSRRRRPPRLIVEEIELAISRLKGEELSILLVEQKIDFACAFADEVAVPGKGPVRWTGAFAAAGDVKDTWLGL